MKPIGKVIKNILYALEVRCPNQECDQVMTLDKYEEHEYYCHLPKCQNSLCGAGSEKLIEVKNNFFHKKNDLIMVYFKIYRFNLF
jgi:hypothetical protein